MVTLGAYMIVKNEEKVLGKCLESLKGLDDILILDTGSTDGTEEVASRYKCRYIKDKYKWDDNFAEARNVAMSMIDTDYLLVIDADEMLIGGDAPLRKAIESESYTYQVVTRPTSNLEGGQYHYSVRLHKNVPKEVFWNGRAHNHLSIAGGPIVENAEVQYGYSPAHELDPDRTLRILTKCVEEKPNSPREVFYLAREHMYRSEWQKAIDLYDRHLTLHPYCAEMPESWLQKAKAYKHLDRYTNARTCALEAIALNANFKEAILFLADLSGPGNARRWREFAETATNENILFVRAPATVKKNGALQVYYCEGMKFYGSKVPLPRYSNSRDPVLFIGLYFDEDYEVFSNHYSDNRVVFWNGSDVLRLLGNEKRVEIISNTKAIHYCHNTQLQAELASVGVEAEILPVFFGRKKDYQKSYVSSARPEVFICAHPGRAEEYGVLKAIKAVNKVPGIGLNIYGVDGELEENVEYHGLVPEEKMDEEIKKYQACIRLNQHDGLSQVVCKANLLGLHVITNDLVHNLKKLISALPPRPVNMKGVYDIDEFVAKMREATK